MNQVSGRWQREGIGNIESEPRSETIAHGEIKHNIIDTITMDMNEYTKDTRGKAPNPNRRAECQPLKQ